MTMEMISRSPPSRGDVVPSARRGSQRSPSRASPASRPARWSPARPRGRGRSPETREWRPRATTEASKG
eukprot:2818281-Pyramimonas_sp.AAC.1